MNIWHKFMKILKEFANTSGEGGMSMLGWLIILLLP